MFEVGKPGRAAGKQGPADKQGPAGKRWAGDRWMLVPGPGKKASGKVRWVSSDKWHRVHPPPRGGNDGEPEHPGHRFEPGKLEPGKLVRCSLGP